MKNIKFFLISLGLIILTGCTPPKDHWWPDIDSTKACEDKFTQEGHISTVHIVSLIAGQNDYIAERYAFFSQAPDQLWFRFSAPSVSVWATFIPWEYDYRHEINAILHSLHGGDTKKVINRRIKLKKLAEELIQSKHKGENDWKIGFILHALGDSYAHTYKFDHNSTKEYAYNEWIGHLCEKGVYSPDSIKSNIKNYIYYINALYDLLKTDKANKKEFEGYKKYIELLSKEENMSDDELIKAIHSYNVTRKGYLNYCEHEKWANSITKKKVHGFLQEIQKSLEIK